jgi:hypothetical protein
MTSEVIEFLEKTNPASELSRKKKPTQKLLLAQGIEAFTKVATFVSEDVLDREQELREERFTNFLAVR